MVLRIPKIAFDIDDVVFKSFNLIANKLLYKYNLTVEEPPTFSLRKYLPSLNEDQYGEVINEALSQVDYFEPYPGAISFIKYYHETSKYPITFITSRNEKMIPYTHNLLDKWFSSIEYNVFFPHVENVRKPNIISKCCVDMFVEDRFKYCIEVANGGNCLVLMLDRPWNRNRLDEKSFKIVPVKNWDDIEMIYNSFLYLF